MELDTQTHLKTLREALVYRLRDLRSEIRAAEQAQLAEPVVSAQGVNDQKDMATRYQDATVAEASVRRDEGEAELCEAALRRLDAGTYGDCHDCGEPIALQRLLVQPAAPRCADCQAAHEHTPDHAHH